MTKLYTTEQLQEVQQYYNYMKRNKEVVIEQLYSNMDIMTQYHNFYANNIGPIPASYDYHEIVTKAKEYFDFVNEILATELKTEPGHVVTLEEYDNNIAYLVRSK